MAEWFFTHHLDGILGALFVMAVGYVSRNASKSMRVRFALWMLAVAVICIAAIPFVP
jgi:hypothetical protein